MNYRREGGEEKVSGESVMRIYPADDSERFREKSIVL
jgi:hypothetical protein